MANLLRKLNPARAFNGLWRHGDFVRLWTSLTITHFGGQITFLALPLTGALLLDATPFEMGVLTALEALPFALFGLFAGVLVDRAPKLPIIIWSDIARAVALLAVDRAYATSTRSGEEALDDLIGFLRAAAKATSPASASA